MVKCKECGSQVSSEAKACPKCGAKPPAATKTSTIVVGIVAFAVIGSCVAEQNRRKSEPAAVQVSATTDPVVSAADRAKQPERLAFIKKAMSEGLVQKIETPGTIPRVWVTPRFKAQDYDFKESVSRTILAYYYVEDQNNDMITLWDVKSGKKIGSYSQLAGFDLDS